ncbi:MAG TPA: LuxR C-terminal-related transcriptional regulator [Gemmatimonadaceae bacterium]|jgi:DNA-binding CsgD family transcriptional regulator|nr:LuxR C-terminal-related transcriptional regulator [Gemmatimonadaceae bacterium]
MQQLDCWLDALNAELAHLKREVAEDAATTRPAIRERLAALRGHVALARLENEVAQLEAGLGTERDALTARQVEVLRLIAEGRSMKQAAAALRVSPRTVAFHKYRMMRQLRLRTNVDLLRFAIRHGVVA